jgi:hypothetical protein
MDFTYNNNEDTKKVKLCINNCGKSIYWNNKENGYFEVESEQKHICPNRKLSVTKSQEQGPLPSIKAIDTGDQLLAEILLKLDRLDRKLDGLRGT